MAGDYGRVGVDDDNGRQKLRLDSSRSKFASLTFLIARTSH